MDVTSDIPIILLSGMAADERLFESQLAEFPNLRIQRWIEPLKNESIQEYAARLAPLVNPGRPCIIGGASFGGMVALEIAEHIRPLGCVLIGSVRSSSELPWQWRICRPMAAIGPDRFGRVAGTLARFGDGILPRRSVRYLRRLSEHDSAFVRWASYAVARWRHRPTPEDTPVFQIHGEDDRTFPVSRTRPDVVVPMGGHALTITSPVAVNKFLREVVSRLTPSR